MKQLYFEIPREVEIIAEKLKTSGFSCYIAWGWCRDHFFWKEGNDIDLFTDSTPDELKNILHIVWEVGKKYGTCIVKEWKKTFEITTFRRDIWSINHRKPAKVAFTKSLEEDAKRRDVTCNAIYFDILRKAFIDPTWGIQDIEKWILRFVGNPQERLEEDILRLLRYIRLKHKYSLTDAETSYKKIFSLSIAILKNISMERIKQEFDKILVLENNTLALQELKDIGFFKIFFPEIEALENTPWGALWHLEGNVWIHTLMTIQEMNTLAKSEEKVDLIWTMLLHDTGKASTVTYDENGRIHYYGHEQVSAKIFISISKKWKFSTASTKKIHYLIDNHLRIAMTLKMHPVKRHHFMLEPNYSSLLLVYEADKKGRLPVLLDGVEETKKYYRKFTTAIKKIRFFTWDDVLKKHPDVSGKKIGEVLEQWNNELLENIEID